MLSITDLPFVQKAPPARGLCLTAYGLPVDLSSRRCSVQAFQWR